jgi:3-hydroxymyristoyl/3-hydroxydecanoyl-(acyl carrier protein) dehydratase
VLVDKLEYKVEIIKNRENIMVFENETYVDNILKTELKLKAIIVGK